MVTISTLLAYLFQERGCLHLNCNDIRTIKDIFNHLGYIGSNNGSDFEEDFMLVLTDTGFINYIDDESIFYCNGYAQEEVFSFGEIVIEFSNTIKDAQKIIALFEHLVSTYSSPTIDFAKEIYINFRDMGYSDLVTRCILYGVLYSLCLNSNLKEFNYREYFYLWVVTNPLKIMSQGHFKDEVNATVSFWEDSNKDIQICYSNLENYSLKALDTIYARKNNIKFHQCSHCGRYFIETNGNNVKFCPMCTNIHSDIKSDDFRKEYRKAYKTMQQRAKRYEDKGNNFNEYITRYCVPFETDAKSRIDEFRQNNDLIGYIEYLKQLKQKYKPKGSDE